MILIAFGANLPAPDGTPPRETCARAIAAVASLPGLALQAVSPFYETAPVPVSDQPSYINGILRLAGAVDPAWLLGQLLAIEAQFGRARSTANAARSLDLDLIAMDGLQRQPPMPDPILPHPRAHERAFVLRPLADVAPDWVHPVAGLSAQALLDRLPPQPIGPA